MTTRTLGLGMMVVLFAGSALAAVGGVEIQGHRGARARYTENTIPAFEHALAVGVDVLELDVVATADDRLVVLHDPELPEGLCQGKAPSSIVHQMALVEVLALSCQRPTDAARFPRQIAVSPRPLITLDDVFALVKGSKAPAAQQVRFNVEAKTVPGRPELAPPPRAFAKLILDTAARHGMQSRLILQSFDHRVLVAAASLAPDVKRAALVAESRPDYVAVAKAAQAHIISPNHHWITADDVKAMHAAGIEVVPWTVNAPTDWERMVAIGVDGIITDDPQACIAHLRRVAATSRGAPTSPRR
jgi:glycerophosphoryl diester phosphodiesterase